MILRCRYDDVLPAAIKTGRAALRMTAFVVLPIKSVRSSRVQPSPLRAHQDKSNVAASRGGIDLVGRIPDMD